MRTVQVIGVPRAETPVPDADAVVVALKSRTVAPAKAVRESRAALAWLRGRRRAADLLQVLLDLRFHAARQHRAGGRRAARRPRRRPRHRLPGLPDQRAHRLQGAPLRRRRAARALGHAQPPADAHAGLQSRGGAGRADAPPGGAGGARDGARGRRCRPPTPSTGCREAGTRHAVVDAIADEDLMAIGTACADLPLMTGGSGVAMGLPANFRAAGLLAAAGRGGDAAGSVRARGGDRRKLLAGDPRADRDHGGVLSGVLRRCRGARRAPARRGGGAGLGAAPGSPTGRC